MADSSNRKKSKPMGGFHRFFFFIWWKLSNLFTSTREGSGIYLIRVKKGKLIYVGRSVNVEKRWRSHKKKLKEGTHANDLLIESYNKYGMKGLKFEVATRAVKPRLPRLEAAFIRYFQGSRWTLTNEVGASKGHHFWS